MSGQQLDDDATGSKSFKIETTTTQQRRKKRNKLIEADDSLHHTTATSGGSSNGKRSKEELLSDAFHRIMAVRARTVDLYASWNSQLLRLSVLVVCMAFYQSYTPIKQTLEEDIEQNELITSSSSSSRVDLLFKLWNTLIHNFQLELSHILLSLVLLCGLFLQARRGQTREGLESSFWREKETWNWVFQWPFVVSTILSLLTITLWREMIENSTSTTTTTTRRDFPITVVFYLIVTGAYSFMSAGLKSTDDNLQVVRSLQQKLTEGVEGKQQQSETKKK